MTEYPFDNLVNGFGKVKVNCIHIVAFLKSLKYSVIVTQQLAQAASLGSKSMLIVFPLLVKL